MKAPRKDRGKRLAEAKGREARRATDAEKFAASGAGNTLLGGAFLLEYDSRRRAEEADAALTLFAKDTALRRAFKEFQLDPKNPHHWKLLAQYMAEALFAEDGRPPKWKDADKLKLYAAAQDRVSKDPQGSKSAIYRALNDLLKTDRYKRETYAALRLRYFEGQKLATVRK